jgi:hypothetical protein
MRTMTGVVTAALVCALGTATLAGTSTIPTRYGDLTMKAEDRVNFEGRLFFHGKPLHQDVRGNNALYHRETFHLANADVVFFEDAGGTACPSLWYFVTVSPAGAAATHAFGSCGDLLSIAKRGRSITVQTRGFLGPFESQAARAKAERVTHTYVFANGVVTENGKPVPCEDNCK